MTLALAVTVLPFSPNDTLFELLKTTLPRFPLLAPAEKFTTERLVAIEAVNVPPFSPKLMPLPFEKVRAVAFVDVLLADTT